MKCTSEYSYKRVVFVKFVLHAAVEYAIAKALCCCWWKQGAAFPCRVDDHRSCPLHTKTLCVRRDCPWLLKPCVSGSARTWLRSSTHFCRHEGNLPIGMEAGLGLLRKMENVVTVYKLMFGVNFDPTLPHPSPVFTMSYVQREERMF